MQIALFVFDRAPETLDEDVVTPAPLAIHANGDPIFLEPPGEGFAGELTALIGVEDLRFAMLAQSLIESLQAKRNVHCDRQLPTQYSTAEPVDHCDQIDKATLHRHVADVRCPSL